MSLKDGLEAGVAALKHLGGILMKKEDLIALGIDEDTAKNVMALHGKTVTQLNAQVATAESERDSAKQELQANQAELDTLKESAKGNEDLEKQLVDLQTKFDESKPIPKSNLLNNRKILLSNWRLKKHRRLMRTLSLLN